MARKALTIFAELLLVVTIIGLLVATWLPIQSFRDWLTRTF